jgi:hypothetical protein
MTFATWGWAPGRYGLREVGGFRSEEGGQWTVFLRNVRGLLPRHMSERGRSKSDFHTPPGQVQKQLAYVQNLRAIRVDYPNYHAGFHALLAIFGDEIRAQYGRGSPLSIAQLTRHMPTLFVRFSNALAREHVSEADQWRPVAHLSK